MFSRKKDRFAIHLGNISSNLVEGTKYFSDYKYTDENDLKVLSDKLKDYKAKSDTLVQQVIDNLKEVFITPIEREDILALAMDMDKVLDGLEHTAALFEIYSVTVADKYIIDFFDAIHKSTIKIDEAVELAFTKSLPNISDHAIKIKAYESQCNEIWRESVKHLFEVEKDSIKLMQYKEIYGEFEEISAHCRKVANTFEATIMKNA